MSSLVPTSPTTEYQNLVQSNQAPSSVYEVVLREDLYRIKRLLASAESNLVALSDDVTSINAQINALQNIRNLHEAILAPVRRLSTNILRHIFHFCCIEAKGAPPITITHICQKWRSIALDTPDLWTTIHANLDALPTQASLIESATYLGRTKNRLLDITLHSVRNVATTPFLERPIIAPLMSQSHRWERLTVHLDAHDLKLLCPLSEPFVALTTIDLRLRHDLEYDYTKEPIDFPPPQIHRHNMLSSLTTINISGAPIVTDLGLPWYQIQECAFHRQILPFAASLTKTMANNLRQFTVADSIHSESATLPNHDPSNTLGGGVLAMMDRLTTLSISETTSSTLTSWFKTISTPLLETLKIDYISDNRWPHDAFTDYIRSSTFLPNLNEFYARSSMTASDLISHLAALPSISTLALTNPENSDVLGRGYRFPIVSNETIMHLGFMYRDRFNVLPKLQHLTLNTEDGLHTYILLKLLWLRHAPPFASTPRLASVTLDRRLMKDAHRHFWKRIQDEGLHLTFV